METSETIPITITKFTCRLCLVQSNSNALKSLFDILADEEIPVSLSQPVQTLAEELATITNIPVTGNDKLPEFICGPCISLMHNAYFFHQRFTASYQILQGIAQSQTMKNQQVDLQQIFESSEEIVFTVEKDLSTESTSCNFDDKVVSSSDNEQNESKIFTNVENKQNSEHRLVNHSKFRQSLTKTEVITHQCPFCLNFFTAKDLHKHISSHKSLNSYLNIPKSERITEKTRFIADTAKFSEITCIFNLPEKLFACNICNDSFKASEFPVHRLVHRGHNEFKCDECDRVFLKESYLKNHKLNHRKDFPFTCQVCGKGFVIKKNYDCHVLTHGSLDDLPFNCNNCSRKFSNIIHLKRHLFTHTGEKNYAQRHVQSLRCQHCATRFHKTSDFDAHKRICSAWPEKRDKSAKNTKILSEKALKAKTCGHCGKVCSSYAARLIHIRRDHQMLRELCPQCGLSVTYLRSHMLTHMKETPFVCHICEKGFKVKGVLDRHMFSHTGQKPFVCGVCQKAFSRSHNLKMHEKTHSDIKDHLCTVCGRRFTEKAYLKKHMLNHERNTFKDS